jgi:integrase
MEETQMAARITSVLVESAAQEMLLDMASKGRAASTIKNSRSFLLGEKGFVTICNQVALGQSRGQRRQAKTDELTTMHSVRYFAQVGQSTGHQNNALKEIRRFLGYLEVNGYIDPLNASRMLNERHYGEFQRKPKTYIPADRFGELLDAAEEWATQDRAIIALALFTLCRSSEVAYLRLGSIHLEDKTLDLYCPKGKKWRYETGDPALWPEITAWLEYLSEATTPEGQQAMTPAELIKAHPDWYYCPRRDYVPGRDKLARIATAGMKYVLDPAQPYASHMEKVMQRAMRCIGTVPLAGDGMHCIRRSAARAMLRYLSEAEGDSRALLKVSLMLGHKDTKTTLVYIGQDLEKMELDRYLRAGGSLFGPTRPEAARSGGNVVQIRRGRKGAQGLRAAEG